MSPAAPTVAESAWDAADPGSRLPKIGVPSAHMLLRVAQQHGVDRRAILAGTGVTEAELGEPDSAIDLTQEIDLARNFVATVPVERDHGLIVAQRYRVSTYGAFGWGMLGAPTLRQKLEFGHRYLDLSYAVCSITRHCGEDDRRVHLRVDDSHLPEDVRPFFLERTVGGIVTLLRDTVPWDGWLHAVHLTRDPSGDADRYRTMFGAPVIFGQRYDEVVINADRLDHPVPGGDETALTLAERLCESLLDRRRRAHSFGDRVEHRVRSSLPHIPSAAEVAAGLYMSERALRRRLVTESTTFSEIVDNCRRGLAADLLASGVTPTRAAAHLGYAGPASFTRAFHRWYGRCPSEYMMSTSPIARRRYPDAARDFES